MPEAVAPAPALAPRHRGTRAVQRLVEFAPSTGGLALWVHHRDAATLGGEGPGAVPVATDGQTLFYAPAFERLPLPEQAGLVAHEVLHIALRHPQRAVALQALVGEVDGPLFNLCADAIVNSALAHLAWLRLPATAVHLDRLLASALGLHLSVEAALLQWDVESLYRAIDDRRNGAGGRREDGPKASRARALGDPSQADLLRPAAGADDAPEAEAEQARTWRERLLRGHAGDGAHSMLRTLLADLPVLRTPWEQILRTRLAHCLAPKPGLNWSRPSRSYIANQGRCGPHRRMPFEPGITPTIAVPRLAVIVDVSGSIDNAVLARFGQEITAIARRQGAALWLIIGDDAVRQVQRFAPGRCDWDAISFTGGGGTDFTPLLEEADRHDPDITVVLTDLDGPARFRPRAPVLWAVPPAPAGAAPVPAAPFGRRLDLR